MFIQSGGNTFDSLYMVKTYTAIGIVRVSQTGGRDGDSFASPRQQRERIQEACERDGMRLVEVIDELDVSGGTPLNERAGLRRAVEAVEAGKAQVIVAAYFDRLVRSLRVQDELVSRVEAAGGRVLALDVGAVTNETAGQWLSATLLGAVSEHQRRSTIERTRPAIDMAIQRGVLPYAAVLPGLRRRADGTLEPDSDTAGVVADAFRLRADGASYHQVREFLAENGIVRSYAGVARLMRSRLVRGEIHFGKRTNLEACEPIVDEETWRRAQRATAKRGRPGKSDRLLARLGVLRCASCGARMIVGMSRQWPYYRCPPTGDCEARATISATLIEEHVAEKVRAALAGMRGRASAIEHVRHLERAAEKAQADLDAAVRAFAGLEDEASVRDRLLELRKVRDSARHDLERLGGKRAAVLVDGGDWDRLTFSERRDLVRAVVRVVTVAPGRGLERVVCELFIE